MKRLLSLALTALLALALAACGGAKFNPNDLSEVQAYAKAAVTKASLPQGHEVKSVSVLLTGDLRAELQAWVPLDAWDVSDVTALVAVCSGKPAQSPEVAAGENPPLLFLLDQDRETVYANTPGSGTAAPAAEDVIHATLAELEEQAEQAQAEAEAYAEANPAAAAFAPLVERRLKYNPGFLDSEEFFNLCNGNMEKLEYGGYRRALQNLEKRRDTLSKAEDFDAAVALLDSDEALQRQILQLRYLAWEVSGKLARQDRRVMASLGEAARKAKKDPAALFTQEHLRQCLIAGQETVDCDGLLRQQQMVAYSLEVLERCTQSDDLEERAYLQERGDVIVVAMADYAAALYDYVEKDQAQKDFETGHEQDLAAYDQGLTAAKERAGTDYESDAGYESLQREYGSTVQEQQSRQEAAGAAQAAAEKVRTDVEAAVKRLDQAEERRLASRSAEEQKAALYDYVRAVTPATRPEKQAEPGQWVRLDDAFVDYLNNQLGG